MANHLNQRKRNTLTTILTMVVIVITSYSLFLAFSINSAALNHERMNKIKSIYFPVLEKIDANIVRVDKINELFIQAVMTGEVELLSTAENHFYKIETVFMEIQTINPELVQMISPIRNELTQYLNLGIKSSNMVMADEDNKNNDFLIKDMNLSLKKLKHHLDHFRNLIYTQFDTLISNAKLSAEYNLYFIIFVVFITILLLSFLTYLVVVNIKMLKVINEKNINLNTTLNEVNQKNTQLNQLNNAIEKQSYELEVARDEALKLVTLKNHFLSNISHELKTPLAAILGFAELLNDSELNDKQRLANSIVQNSHHLLNLINSILDLSELEADRLNFNLTTIHLAPFFNEICQKVKNNAEHKGLDFSFDIQTSPETIISDPLRLHQAIYNICDNAVKYTKSGSITFSTWHERENNQLNILIKDTGIGIKPENMQTLFDTFNQADLSAARKHGGLGLGLSISYKLLQYLNGSIEVQSVVNKGSQFLIKLSLR